MYIASFFYRGFFWALWILLCLHFSAHAELTITEIHPTQEYIEIYNTSDNSVDTQEFQYSEQTSSGDTKKYFFVDAQIPAQSYYLIPLSRKINDSGDRIGVYKNGEELDAIDIPKKEEGASWSLIEGIWKWSIPTPGLSNKVSEEEEEETEEKNEDENKENENTENQDDDETQNNEDIELEDNTGEGELGKEDGENNTALIPFQISELFPNPVGSDSGNEWIEIYNPNNVSQSIYLWSLEDASGKKYEFEEIIFEPHEYRVFTKTVSLNNSDESIRLFSPEEIAHDFISFSGASKEGKSMIREKNIWKWTDTPTVNTENIYSSLEDETEEVDVEEYRDPLQLFEEKNVSISLIRPFLLELQIRSVSPNSSMDYIEVFCLQCNQSIQGVRIGTDGNIFTITDDIYAKTGDTLRFVFQKDSLLPPRQTANGWVIYIPLSGLTSTDETIYVTDETSRILDMMCYANYDSYFPSSEKKEMLLLEYHGAWKASESGTEYGCVASTGLARNGTIDRILSHDDTNTKADWKITQINDQQDIPIPISMPSDTIKSPLQFSSFLFDREYTQITIQNIGSSPVSLNDYFVSNKKSFLSSLYSDDDLERDTQSNILAPSEVVTLTLPVTKTKKYIRENMTLELRDGTNTLHDFVCINLALEEKERKKSMVFISNANRKGIWTRGYKDESCFSWYSSHPVLFERNDIHVPSSFSNYSRQEIEEHLDKEIDADINNKDEDDSANQVTKLEEISELDSEQIEESDTIKKNEDDTKNNISIVVSSDNSRVIFSGSIDTEVSQVHFFIPKRNLQWTQKVKKGELLAVLEYPLVSRRYSVDMTLIYKNGDEQTLPRKRFYVENDLASHLLSSLSFATVLPNPEGKDSGNEVVTIQNTSGKAGWIKNTALVLEGGTRRVKKSLPDIFLDIDEAITLPHAFVPTLRNTDGKLSLHDDFENSLVQIHWEKARNGEWFGDLAPAYILPIKTNATKKSSKKSTSTQSKGVSAKSNISIPIVTESFSTEKTDFFARYIGLFDSQHMFLDEQGIIHEYEIDTFFPHQNILLTPLSRFRLETKRDGSLKYLSSVVFPKANESNIISPYHSSIFSPSLWSFIFLWIISLCGSGVVVFLQRQNRVEEQAK